MDYLTRKSVAKQYGSVGTWTHGGRFCKYPCLSAIGVRHPDDNREIKEVLDDLALDLEIGTNPVRWRPEEIEEALAAVGTPEELQRKAHEALVRIAAASKPKRPEGAEDKCSRQIPP